MNGLSEEIMRRSSWLERGMSEADGARRGGEGAHVGSGEAVGRDAFGMRAMQGGE